VSADPDDAAVAELERLTTTARALLARLRVMAYSRALTPEEAESARRLSAMCETLRRSTVDLLLATAPDPGEALRVVFRRMPEGKA
jgi:hypothetical protein